MKYCLVHGDLLKASGDRQIAKAFWDVARLVYAPQTIIDQPGFVTHINFYRVLSPYAHMVKTTMTTHSFFVGVWDGLGRSAH